MDLTARFLNPGERPLDPWKESGSATPPAPKLGHPIQRQVRLNPEHIVQLILQYEAGRSVRQLTAEFDINRDTVLEHLKRAGVWRRPHVRKMTDAQVAQAAQLYATGISLLDVALHFDVNASTIRNEFTRAGVPVRPRRGWADR